MYNGDCKEMYQQLHTNVNHREITQKIARKQMQTLTHQKRHACEEAKNRPCETYD